MQNLTLAFFLYIFYVMTRFNKVYCPFEKDRFCNLSEDLAGEPEVGEGHADNVFEFIVAQEVAEAEKLLYADEDEANRGSQDE